MAKGRSIDLLEAGLGKQFGTAVTRASLTKSLKVIPTGILALDYALGTGGWPIGYCHGVYGPRDIGKSSIIGLSAIREAQKLDKVPVVILVEPTGGENWTNWVRKNGVDPDRLLCMYPESGEEAFAMAHKVVRSGNCDLLIFDSIGGLLSESEFADDGKMKMGGQAGLITWGMKALGPLVYKHDVCALIMNQIRADMGSRFGGVQQPGGNAIEHTEQIILRLRRGKDKFSVKIHGEDVIVGRQIIGVVERNKANEGEGQKAIFNYFGMTTEEYPFGVDKLTDVIATGKRTGALTVAHGGNYELPNGKKIKGAPAVGEYLEANPAVYEMIREGVLRSMLTKTSRAVLDPATDAEPDVSVVEPA